MKYDEALEWLRGYRSMTNIIPREPFETWEVRIAQADAAVTQQAYYGFEGVPRRTAGGRP